MQRVTTVVACAAVSGVLLVAGCFDSPTKSTTPVSSVETDGKSCFSFSETYSSQTVGDSLLIITIAKDTTYNYGTTCNGGDTLQMDTVTMKAGADTVKCRVVGDSMIMVDSTKVLGSGAVIITGLPLTRSGSGTGILGTWVNNTFSSSYSVISGTLTTAEKDSLDAFYQTLNLLINVRYWTVNEVLQIGPSSYSITGSEAFDVVGYYLSEAYAETSIVSMSISRPSPNTIRIIGNKDLDTVTETFESAPGGNFYSANYTETFTSSIPANTEYVYYTNPTACPDNTTPPWDASFRAANPKTHGKVSSNPVLRAC